MKVLIVDDEVLAMRSLAATFKSAYMHEAEIVFTYNGKAALRAMKESSFDLVFIEVEMHGMDGLKTAAVIREEYPDTRLVIVTGNSDHAIKAWELFVSGYLLKPVGVNDMRRVLDHLKITDAAETARIKAQCFGNFDVFAGDSKLVFQRSGAKELFAYLINRRGSGVTVGELCAALWEEAKDPEQKKGAVRVYFMELKKTLEEAGFKDVLRHERNDYSVNPAYIDCDYYRYLEGDEKARSLFHGEYMSQYSWAEPTLGALMSM